MNVAGQNDVRNAQLPVRGLYSLAHASRIDRGYGRAFEYSHPRRFRRRRESLRVVERVNVKSIGKVNGVEITVALEVRANPLRRPPLDRSTDLVPDQPNQS